MVNGIVHSPSADKETLVPENRDGLLSAMPKPALG
jgi:hypothetical protein